MQHALHFSSEDPPWNPTTHSTSCGALPRFSQWSNTMLHASGSPGRFSSSTCCRDGIPSLSTKPSQTKKKERKNPGLLASQVLCVKGGRWPVSVGGRYAADVCRRMRSETHIPRQSKRRIPCTHSHIMEPNPIDTDQLQIRRRNGDQKKPTRAKHTKKGGKSPLPMDDTQRQH